MSTQNRSALLGELIAAIRLVGTSTVLFSTFVGKRLGLTPTDVESMEILERLGPITAGQLAAETRLTTGAITGVIDRLEQRGLVRRERDPADRRRVLVVLDDERVTRDVLPLYEPMQRSAEEAFKQFTSRQLETVLEFINTLTAASERAMDEVRMREG